MFAVAAIMIGFFIFVIARVTDPRMTALYTDLAFEDSTAVVRQLESLNIQHELRNDGAIVLVPKEEVLKVRMRLAELGLPTGGSIGYEIFDKSDTLGATSFVQNINHLRALEGELSRTIRTIERVIAARVHLVLPSKELFRRDKRSPTASIVLKLRGAMSGGQIRAIQHIVATAVDGLQPQRVSIVDENGRLLASGAKGDESGVVASSLEERTVTFESRLRDQIEEIISSVVGPGRARVRVAAQMDYNRITKTSSTFDPDSQVVRSTQTREEASDASRGQGDNTVSTGNQLPNAGNNANPDKRKETASTTEETVNYEISKTTKTEVLEAGRINRISVAVLVDGTYANDANGELVYTARTPEQLNRIATLVRSAVGFDKVRGDQVEVVNLRFAEAPNRISTDTTPDGLFDFTKDDILYMSELGVILLISILALLFGVRPLIRRIITPDEATDENAPALLTADGEAIGSVEGGQAVDSVDGMEQAVVTSQAIAEAQAEGEVHASTIATVGDLIEENPNEAVIIVRGWLHDAA